MGLDTMVRIPWSTFPRVSEPRAVRKFSASSSPVAPRDMPAKFRTSFTVPESYDGKELWLYLRTQIEEWDDAKNPQFLIFVNGELKQGADMNHRELLLSRCAKAGDQYTIDLQAYSGILHPEFRLLADVQELNPAVNALYYDIQVPLWAMGRMDPKGKTCIDLCTALNDAINLLDMRKVPSEAFYASVEEARALLAKTVYGEMAGEKEIIASVKKAWTKSGRKVGEIKSIDLYIKPEEGAVYYVINGVDTGAVAF